MSGSVTGQGGSGGPVNEMSSFPLEVLLMVGVCEGYNRPEILACLGIRMTNYGLRGASSYQSRNLLRIPLFTGHLYLNCATR